MFKINNTVKFVILLTCEFNYSYCEYNEKIMEKYNFQTLSGKDFKKKFPNYKAYKILKANLGHYGMQYKLGENIDILPFNNSNTCSPGGLYFTDLQNIFEYIMFGKNIGNIKIMDDSRVYIENGKCKTDKFILNDIQSIKSFVENSSENVQSKAVKNDGCLIKYIKNPSENVQLQAVKNNGWAIEYIKNPSENVQLEAVKNNGSSIEYITNPSENVQSKAAKNDMLKFILNFFKFL